MGGDDLVGPCVSVCGVPSVADEHSALTLRHHRIHEQRLKMEVNGIWLFISFTNLELG